MGGDLIFFPHIINHILVSSCSGDDYWYFGLFVMTNLLVFLMERH